MELENCDTGHIIRTFIFDGTINNPMALQAFPVDFNDMEINFTGTSSISTNGEIQRAQDETHMIWYSLLEAPKDIRASTSKEKFFNIAFWNKQLTGWDFHSVRYSIEGWFAPSGVKYENLQLKFKIFRKTGYYFSRILFPLNLLFIITMMIFAFDVTDYADRMNASTTMFLAAMAFLYVISAELPKVGYLTKMDYCIMFEMLAQILVMVESVVLFLVEFEADTGSLINTIFAISCIGLYLGLEVGILASGWMSASRVRAIVSMDTNQPPMVPLSATMF